MTVGAKRIVIKVSAVIILGSAAIMWVALFIKGFTMGGVFLPAFYTGMGPFLWFLGAKLQSWIDRASTGSGNRTTPD